MALRLDLFVKKVWISTIRCYWILYAWPTF